MFVLSAASGSPHTSVAIIRCVSTRSGCRAKQTSRSNWVGVRRQRPVADRAPRAAAGRCAIVPRSMHRRLERRGALAVAQRGRGPAPAARAPRTAWRRSRRRRGRARAPCSRRRRAPRRRRSAGSARTCGCAGSPRSPSMPGSPRSSSTRSGASDAVRATACSPGRDGRRRCSRATRARVCSARRIVGSSSTSRIFTSRANGDAPAPRGSVDDEGRAAARRGLDARACRRARPRSRARWRGRARTRCRARRAAVGCTARRSGGARAPGIPGPVIDDADLDRVRPPRAPRSRTARRPARSARRSAAG